MRIESNRAWQESVRWIAANREVLWALAGLFFAFPIFLLLIAYPQPDPPPSASEEQMIKLVTQYTETIVPPMMAAMTVMLVGALAALAYGDTEARPTLGQALKQALLATPTSIAAFLISQILLGGGQLLLLAGVTKLGIPALSALTWIAATVAGFYITARLSLAAALAVSRRERNPFALLKRCWEITRRNGSAIFLFYLLFFIAAFVLLVIVALIFGTLLAVLLPLEPARIISSVISSALIGMIVLHFVALTKALYRQLTETSDTNAKASGT